MMVSKSNRRTKVFGERAVFLVKTALTTSTELTNLLTLSREELNLKTLVFLSRGLMVN